MQHCRRVKRRWTFFFLAGIRKGFNPIFAHFSIRFHSIWIISYWYGIVKWKSVVYWIKEFSTYINWYLSSIMRWQCSAVCCVCKIERCAVMWALLIWNFFVIALKVHCDKMCSNLFIQMWFSYFLSFVFFSVGLYLFRDTFHSAWPI